MNSNQKIVTSPISVSLPESLTKIGVNFLYDRFGIIQGKVTLLSQTPPTIENVSFAGEAFNFYVPKGTLSSYQTA